MSYILKRYWIHNYLLDAVLQKPPSVRHPLVQIINMSPGTLISIQISDRKHYVKAVLTEKCVQEFSCQFSQKSIFKIQGGIVGLKEFYAKPDIEYNEWILVIESINYIGAEGSPTFDEPVCVNEEKDIQEAWKKYREETKKPGQFQMDAIGPLQCPIKLISSENVSQKSFSEEQTMEDQEEDCLSDTDCKISESQKEILDALPGWTVDIASSQPAKVFSASLLDGLTSQFSYTEAHDISSNNTQHKMVKLVDTGILDSMYASQAPPIIESMDSSSQSVSEQDYIEKHNENANLLATNTDMDMDMYTQQQQSTKEVQKEREFIANQDMLTPIPIEQVSPSPSFIIPSLFSTLDKTSQHQINPSCPSSEKDWIIEPSRGQIKKNVAVVDNCHPYESHQGHIDQLKQFFNCIHARSQLRNTQQRLSCLPRRSLEVRWLHKYLTLRNDE